MQQSPLIFYHIFFVIFINIYFIYGQAIGNVPLNTIFNNGNKPITIYDEYTGPGFKSYGYQRIYPPKFQYFQSKPFLGNINNYNDNNNMFDFMPSNSLPGTLDNNFMFFGAPQTNFQQSNILSMMRKDSTPSDEEKQQPNTDDISNDKVPENATTLESNDQQREEENGIDDTSDEEIIEDKGRWFPPEAVYRPLPTFIAPPLTIPLAPTILPPSPLGAFIYGREYSADKIQPRSQSMTRPNNRLPWSRNGENEKNNDIPTSKEQIDQDIQFNYDGVVQKNEDYELYQQQNHIPLPFPNQENESKPPNNSSNVRFPNYQDHYPPNNKQTAISNSKANSWGFPNGQEPPMQSSLGLIQNPQFPQIKAKPDIPSMPHTNNNQQKLPQSSIESLSQQSSIPQYPDFPMKNPQQSFIPDYPDFSMGHPPQSSNTGYPDFLMGNPPQSSIPNYPGFPMGNPPQSSIPNYPNYSIGSPQQSSIPNDLPMVIPELPIYINNNMNSWQRPSKQTLELGLSYSSEQWRRHLNEDLLKKNEKKERKSSINPEDRKKLLIVALKKKNNGAYEILRTPNKLDDLKSGSYTEPIDNNHQSNIELKHPVEAEEKTDSLSRSEIFFKPQRQSSIPTPTSFEVKLTHNGNNRHPYSNLQFPSLVGASPSLSNNNNNQLVNFPSQSFNQPNLELPLNPSLIGGTNVESFIVTSSGSPETINSMGNRIGGSDGNGGCMHQELGYIKNGEEKVIPNKCRAILCENGRLRFIGCSEALHKCNWSPSPLIDNNEFPYCCGYCTPIPPTPYQRPAMVLYNSLGGERGTNLNHDGSSNFGRINAFEKQQSAIRENTALLKI